MSSQLTYREKFTAEMTFGGVPCDTEWLRNSNLFKEGLKKFDSGEWKYFEKEVWKDIEGYEGYYQISNHGRVKSFAVSTRVKYRKPILNKKGYLHIKLKIKNKGIYTGIHRLVAMAFIPNPDNKPQVNHINGIKIDNHVSNLEWNTNLENIAHSYKMGLSTTREGEKAGNAKFSKHDILRIRELVKLGNTDTYISKIYGVSRSCITFIRHRSTYKNIE